MVFLCFSKVISVRHVFAWFWKLLKADPFGNRAWAFCWRPHWPDAKAAAGERQKAMIVFHFDFPTFQFCFDNFHDLQFWHLQIFLYKIAKSLTGICQEKSQSYRNLPYFQHLGSDEVFEAESSVLPSWKLQFRCKRLNFPWPWKGVGSGTSRKSPPDATKDAEGHVLDNCDRFQIILLLAKSADNSNLNSMQLAGCCSTPQSMLHDRKVRLNSIWITLSSWGFEGVVAVKHPLMNTLETRSLSGIQNGPEYAVCCTFWHWSPRNKNSCVDAHMFIETVLTCFDVLTLSCAQACFLNVISKLNTEKHCRMVWCWVLFLESICRRHCKRIRISEAHTGKALVILPRIFQVFPSILLVSTSICCESLPTHTWFFVGVRNSSSNSEFRGGFPQVIWLFRLSFAWHAGTADSCHSVYIYI